MAARSRARSWHLRRRPCRLSSTPCGAPNQKSKRKLRFWATHLVQGKQLDVQVPAGAVLWITSICGHSKARVAIKPAGAPSVAPRFHIGPSLASSAALAGAIAATWSLEAEGAPASGSEGSTVDLLGYFAQPFTRKRPLQARAPASVAAAVKSVAPAPATGALNKVASPADSKPTVAAVAAAAEIPAHGPPAKQAKTSSPAAAAAATASASSTPTKQVAGVVDVKIPVPKATIDTPANAPPSEPAAKPYNPLKPAAYNPLKPAAYNPLKPAAAKVILAKPGPKPQPPPSPKKAPLFAPPGGGFEFEEPVAGPENAPIARIHNKVEIKFNVIQKEGKKERTVEKGQIEVRLGQSEVLDGWVSGNMDMEDVLGKWCHSLVGARLGSRRRIHIPPGEGFEAAQQVFDGKKERRLKGKKKTALEDSLVVFDAELKQILSDSDNE